MPTRSTEICKHSRPIRAQTSYRIHNGSGTIDKADITRVIVTCTGAGRFAYVANQLSNDPVVAYAIDSASGELTAGGGLTVPPPSARRRFRPAAVDRRTAAAGQPGGSLRRGQRPFGSDDVSVYAMSALDHPPVRSAIQRRRRGECHRQQPLCRDHRPHRQLSLCDELRCQQRIGVLHRPDHRPVERTAQFTLRSRHESNVVEIRSERKLSLCHRLRQRRCRRAGDRPCHRLVERGARVSVRGRRGRARDCHRSGGNVCLCRQ